MTKKSEQLTSPLKLERSLVLLSRAKRSVPGITHSMMKRPEQFAPGEFPVYLRSGEGALVTDVDGNQYIDFICGLGANSLGHRHEAIESAISAALLRGILHSLPTELEVDVAESLIEAVPGAEMARFFKTGADATSAAVRLARAATGRESIVVVGYNGWHDHFMFDTTGVPGAFEKLTTRIPLMSPDAEVQVLQAIEEGKHAALLMTVPYNRILSSDFVHQVRDACDRSGTLLVFDEIVTGFRLAPGGAQAYFDVKADIVCVSKALAGGMPLSALVGSREIMSKMEQLQVSTTFGGETLSLAACGAALRVYRETNYYSDIAEMGKILREGINAAACTLGVPLQVVGYDPLPLFQFDRSPQKHVPLMTRFVALMAERGFLLRRDLNFISAAHTRDQIDGMIDAAHSSLKKMNASASSMP